ncbi:phosphatidylethanolamine-binding protein [Scleroderma yunnanense]
MFSVRLLRTSASRQAAPEASVATRTRPFKPRRPNISREHPRKWNRPLAFGVLQAYDEALKYIKTDSETLKAEAQQLHASLQKEKTAPEPDREAIHEMERKLGILEVQSQVNLPEVRWKVRNGMADMSTAVDRHIVERRWREEGRLDELMERIHQMFVVPDVVPHLHPSLDLRVTYPEHLVERRHNGESSKRKHALVEPGTYLHPEQTIEPPKLYTDVFHTDTRFYTLLLLDPDVPDEANGMFQTYLHWLQPNIPLSALSPSPVADMNTHTEYIPPHPQKGTPYHRYTVLLLPQKSHISVPVFSRDQRHGFSVRDFIDTYDLDLSAGGGAFMWREVWDDAVSSIYKGILGVEEPRYGKPPKPDRYAGAKARNKYFK